MGLVVITNNSEGHLGTPDRDALLRGDSNPKFWDYPAKHQGFKESVAAFRQLTLPTETYRRALDGKGQPLPEVMIINSTRLPSDAELLTVHTADYLNRFKQASEHVANLQRAGEAPFDLDFGSEAAISPGTYHASMTAAGAALEAVDMILNDPSKTVFCNTWPPGHHAEPEQAMGFCYISTAGMAAIYARDHAIRVDPSRPNRVLVIDIDNHRGNGTATALANQPNIFFVDFEQVSAYDHSQGRYVDGTVDLKTNIVPDRATEYPPLNNDLELELIGNPRTIAPNIRTITFLKHPEISNTECATPPEDLLVKFAEQVMGDIDRFKPDVIIWSVGLDSAANDVLGGMGHFPGSFHTLIAGLRIRYRGARHMAIAEGGYHSDNWTRCLQPVLAGFHEDLTNPRQRSHFYARYVGLLNDPSWKWMYAIKDGAIDAQRVVHNLFYQPYKALSEEVKISMTEFIRNSAIALQPYRYPGTELLCDLAAACLYVILKNGDAPLVEKIRYLELAMEATHKSLRRDKKSFDRGYWTSGVLSTDYNLEDRSMIRWDGSWVKRYLSKKVAWGVTSGLGLFRTKLSEAKWRIGQTIIDLESEANSTGQLNVEMSEKFRKLKAHSEELRAAFNSPKKSPLGIRRLNS